MDIGNYSREGIKGYIGFDEQRMRSLCLELGYTERQEWFTRSEYAAIMQAAGWTSTEQGWTK